MAVSFASNETGRLILRREWLIERLRKGGRSSRNRPSPARVTGGRATTECGTQPALLKNESVGPVVAIGFAITKNAPNVVPFAVRPS